MSGPIDLYVVAGQSNAEGRGNSALSPAVDSAWGKEYNGSGSVLGLADPVGGASTGSAWPAFANAIHALRDRPLCITETAGSGQSLLAATDDGSNGNWSSSGARFGECLTRIAATLAKLTLDGWTPTLRAILWHQGETDAGSAAYTADALLQAYYDGLLDLLDRFQAAYPGVPLCVFQLGHPATGDTTKYVAVRDAQAAAAVDSPDIHLVYEGCVTFPDLGYMTDTLHYSQPGYNLMGAGGAVGVARALYGWPRHQSRIGNHGGLVRSVSGALR